MMQWGLRLEMAPSRGYYALVRRGSYQRRHGHRLQRSAYVVVRALKPASPSRPLRRKARPQEERTGRRPEWKGWKDRKINCP